MIQKTNKTAKTIIPYCFSNNTVYSPMTMVITETRVWYPTKIVKHKSPSSYTRSKHVIETYCIRALLEMKSKIVIIKMSMIRSATIANTDWLQ